MSMLTRKGTVRKTRRGRPGSGSRKGPSLPGTSSPRPNDPLPLPSRTFGDIHNHSSYSAVVAESVVRDLKNNLNSSAKPSPAKSLASTVVEYDDKKHLCKTNVDWSHRLSVDQSDFVLQIQEANKEADDTCDFGCRALEIMCNTVGVAVLIGGMLALPLAMVSIGVKYLSECPKQPKIPVYLLVGGCFGILKLVGSLWQNIQYRQFNDVEYFDDELEENGRSVATADTYKMMDVILTLFLLSWLCAGSYWVFSVWQPHFTQLLHEPSNWCDKTVYLFAVYQIFGCYFLIGLYILIFGSLACCYKYTTLFEANID